MPKARKATEYDVMVGQRLRAARLRTDVSQTDLGTALGVSFQQIQKYEKGVNRVSVGSAQAMAAHLKCSVLDIIGPVGLEREEDPVITEFFSTPGSRLLAEAWLALPARQRSALLIIAGAKENGGAEG